MGKTSEAIMQFSNNQRQRRLLNSQLENQEFDRQLKLGELATKGVNVTEQQTPRRLFGFIPAGSQRSLSMSFDPSMSPDYAKNKAQTSKLESEAEINRIKLERMQNAGGATASVPEGYKSYIDPNSGEEKVVRDPAYVNENKERRRLQIKREEEPVPVSEIGRDTLAGESELLIPQAIQTLFPTGKPDSFRRDVAFESKGMFGQKLPLSEEAQNVKRWLGQALAAKQLIQTGVSANPGEYQRMADAYLAGFTSNPNALYAGLNELKNFYGTYRKSLRSRGRESYQPQAEKTGGGVPAWVPKGDENFYLQEIQSGTTPQELEAFFKKKVTG